MSMETIGNDSARRDFARLLRQAERGQGAVITQWGRPVAVLLPIGHGGGRAGRRDRAAAG
jgi:prevent-host-death family protein